MEKRSIVSLVIQFIICVGSSLMVLKCSLKDNPNIGKLIFYAWLALATQLNIFQKINKE